MIDTTALKNRILTLAMTGQVANNGKSVKQLFESLCDNAYKIDKNKVSDKNYDLSELPFEIPDDWKWVWLGDIFQHNTGKALNASNTDGTSLEYITTSNLYWDRFELEELKSMFFKDSEIEKCTVKKGDLLICEGGDIGRAAIWSEDYEMRIQNHIHRLRPYVDEICVRFYYYVMMYYKNNGLISGRGIGLQGLSSKKLHAILVPLPDSETQRLIAEKIDESFSLIDTIDELQQQYSSDLEVLKSKIIDAGIQGKLTEQLPEDGTAEELLRQIADEKKLIKEKKIKAAKALPEISEDEIPFEIPSNWKWVKFNDIANIIGTGMIRSGQEQYDEADYYYFKMNNNENFTGKCDFSNMTMVNASSEECEKYKLEEGDFLFNTRNSAELVGKTAVVHDLPSENILLNNNILKVLFLGNISPDYINYFFISRSGRRQLEQFITSTTNVAAIYQRQIITLAIPLPPLAEQRRIVNRVNQIIDQI